MARKPTLTKLNASTIDILNTIRANAPKEYQDLVPKIEKDNEIVKVGDILCGYPQLANNFISALVNRIALVRVKSATFNNAYAKFKKGYLEFGETVEEVFVNITKAREFSAEKAESRELKRSLPDIRTAFHAMNWRVQYPITIQDEDLRQAFLSVDGVTDLIARIVDAVYTSAEYDEFLLFKYLIIKAVANGKVYPISFDATDMKNAAVTFRGASNMLTFMSSEYNSAGVTTVTPRENQYIFMDSRFNAQFDVDVLSAAFNMDKADFLGRIELIDDFTKFDHDRFSVIMADSDVIEPITSEELALMSDVKAVLFDEEWFQVYDNMSKMTEKYVASGAYWNYFYNVWKTISSSPFSNAVAFIDNANGVQLPASIEVTIEGKTVTEDGTAVFTLATAETDGFGISEPRFIQNRSASTSGIAVHPWGGVIIPADKAYVPTASVGGKTYTAVTTAGGTTAYQLADDSLVEAVFYLVPEQ